MASWIARPQRVLTSARATVVLCARREHELALAAAECGSLRARAIIHGASALGKAAAPEMTAYVTSEFALVGFSESLRQELHHEREIHVCTILPGATDTPIWKELVALGRRRPVAA